MSYQECDRLWTGFGDNINLIVSRCQMGMEEKNSRRLTLMMGDVKILLLPVKSAIVAIMVGVAQLVRASDCGSEGRGFESRLPPFQ